MLCIAEVKCEDFFVVVVDVALIAERSLKFHQKRNINCVTENNKKRSQVACIMGGCISRNDETVSINENGNSRPPSGMSQPPAGNEMQTAKYTRSLMKC